MRVLVVNPGSSSVKTALVQDGTALHSRTVDHPGSDGDSGDLVDLTEEWGPVDAVGVRFVHGGPDHTRPVRIDERVLRDLDAVTSLAPLHLPPAIAAARSLRRARPDLPAVACFDTTFHVDLPAGAATYALPREWNRRWRLRRYGFHGLSHAYAARRALELTGLPRDGSRVLVAHLGSGASLAAVLGGRSVDTTMGFTPLEGLVMGTRSGSVDPGLLAWLVTEGHVEPDELSRVLEQESGLLGLSGRSADLREVVAGADAGDPDCRLALEVHHHRLRREAGGMVASLGGLDVLVLTGGVGEASSAVGAEVRADLAHGLAHVGVDLDTEANTRPVADGGPRDPGDPGDTGDPVDREIGATGSRVRVLVVEAREDLEIARQVAGVLA